MRKMNFGGIELSIRKLIDNLEEYFVVATMALMTLLVFVQVIMRYVFSSSLSWSEELARFIFLWVSWVGASYAVKERTHFRVEMFANLFRNSQRKYFELLILSIWFAFALIMAYLGTELVLFLMETGQTSAAMEVPMSWVYASVPTGCALMSLRLVMEILKVFSNADTTNSPDLISKSKEGTI